MSNIIIIGFMGSGKSTIGKALGTELDRLFIDTDSLIEMNVGIDIATLLAQYSEDYLREKEAWICSQIASNISNSIISTGGGFVINTNPREMGKVVYLKCSFETIYKRVINHEHPRPLFRDKNSAYKLYSSRLTLYEKYADITVNTDSSIDEAIKRVKDQLL
ncbi:MAG: shikimate kinase [Campylobacterales bacterium]